MTFPLIFKYDYDDTYFCICVTVNEKIPEFKEKIEYSKNFNLYTNLNENQKFSGLKKLFQRNDENFFGDNVVNLEFLDSIKLTGNRFKQNDLRFWVHGHFLPKIKHFIFPDSDSSMYGSTQKIAENENLGYTVENHQKLYKMEMSKRGFTPVEICLHMKFDFQNVFGF